MQTEWLGYRGSLRVKGNLGMGAKHDEQYLLRALLPDSLGRNTYSGLSPYFLNVRNKLV